MAHNEPLLAGALADRLGLLKAQIAELKTQEKAIAQELIDTGLPVIEGVTFRVAISRVGPKTKVDWEAIATHLKPSRQLMTAHTSATAPCVAVRVSARKAG